MKFLSPARITLQRTPEKTSSELKKRGMTEERHPTAPSCLRVERSLLTVSINLAKIVISFNNLTFRKNLKMGCSFEPSHSSEHKTQKYSPENKYKVLCTNGNMWMIYTDGQNYRASAFLFACGIRFRRLKIFWTVSDKIIVCFFTLQIQP